MAADFTYVAGFDLPSFLVATLIFLVFVVAMSSILRFVHQRYFSQHSIRRSRSNNILNSIWSDNAVNRFIVQRDPSGQIEPYKPPPYYAVSIKKERSPLSDQPLKPLALESIPDFAEKTLVPPPDAPISDKSTLAMAHFLVQMPSAYHVHPFPSSTAKHYMIASCLVQAAA